MSDKLTPWFPAHVKPVRVGVYIASIERYSGSFRYWNGHHWSLDHISPEHAMTCVGTKTAFEDDVQWRGLAKEPK